MDNALIALLALLANALFGGPRALYEASKLTRLARIPAKLLRDHERVFADSPERRGLLVAYALIAALALGVLLYFMLRHHFKIFEVIIVACLLPARSMMERVWQIKTALGAQDVASAKKALEGTVWKHHVLLDAHGVARAGIELAAVTLAEKIIAPLICYLLLGLPGLFVIKTIGMMKEALPAGFDAEAQCNRLLFGAPFVVAWIASRLASIFWVIASLLLGGGNLKPKILQLSDEAVKPVIRPYTLAVPAILIGAALGGPASAYVSPDWIGGGTPKALASHVTQAWMLSALVWLQLVLFLGLFLG